MGPDDYLDKTDGFRYCRLMIRGLPSDYPIMLFGDTFFRKYPILYDKLNN